MSKPARNCEHCGEPFTEKQFFQKYCSSACRLRAWRRWQGKQTEHAEETAPEPAH